VDLSTSLLVSDHSWNVAWWFAGAQGNILRPSPSVLTWETWCITWWQTRLRRASPNSLTQSCLHFVSFSRSAFIPTFPACTHSIMHVTISSERKIVDPWSWTMAFGNFYEAFSSLQLKSTCWRVLLADVIWKALDYWRYFISLLGPFYFFAGAISFHYWDHFIFFTGNISLDYCISLDYWNHLLGPFHSIAGDISFHYWNYFIRLLGPFHSFAGNISLYYLGYFIPLLEPFHFFTGNILLDYWRHFIRLLETFHFFAGDISFHYWNYFIRLLGPFHFFAGNISLNYWAISLDY